MLNIFHNCKVSTSLPYGLWQKRPRFFVYPLFRLLLCDKRNAGKGCFILGISYASDGSSTKVPKVNHMKIVIFRKNFSYNLINIYIKWLNTFFFWHFDLIYFFAQFSARKKCSKKSFSAYFAISDARFDPICTNLITNIREKIQGTKLFLICLDFWCPNTFRSFQNWSILLHWI